MASRVARDVAEAEFARMCDAFEVEPGPTEDERRLFAAVREDIVRAMEKCKVVVDETGHPVMELKGGKKARFREPLGTDFMGGYVRAEQGVGQTAAALASVTGLAPVDFSSLPMRDFQLAKTILNLFT